MLIHVVEAGDTLWQLANLYRVTVDSIVETNRLENPNRLVIGQSLVIPTQGAVYTVGRGDTLFTISRQFGVTVQDIVDYNQIENPDQITPGTVLYIPPITHMVQPGETLFRIAQAYGFTLPNLLKENNLSETAILQPGDVIVIPRTQRPFISVNGYIYFFGEEAVPIIDEVGYLLTYLSPFAYLIREDGSLEPIDDSPAIRAAYAQNAVPMMAITNFTSTSLGENLASQVLNSPQIRGRLIENVLAIMREKGYLGLNVDFENVLPQDREAYNTFLQEAADRMHQEGYFISTAVAPKVGPEQTGLLYEAHDYEAHGRIVDFVILMTYEWGYRLGPPRAISPVNEIRRVLDYAVTVIPRNKIYLGFQIYARDWTLPFVQGRQARTFSPQEAMNLAVRYNVPILYDVAAQSPFFRYTNAQGQRHEVWFEDARSAQAKFNLAKEYRLGGISYWSLGYDYPQNWVLLNDNFIIRKLLG
jgi:spore germination protein